MIDLNFQNKTSDRKWTAKFFEGILEKAVAEKKIKINRLLNYGLSVILVGENKIRQLNKKYRDKNKITDVLSFPLNDFKTGKGTDNNGIISPVRSSPPLGSFGPRLRAGETSFGIDLGDIFICLPFAKKMAKKNDTSIEGELTFLTIHGFLHLLGFDHEKDKGEMINIQNKILKKMPF